jgi:hypothetical protein
MAPRGLALVWVVTAVACTGSDDFTPIGLAADVAEAGVDTTASLDVDAAAPPADSSATVPNACPPQHCPKGYGDCFTSQCQPATGACTWVMTADGAPCKTGGPCGGAGTCQQGVCTGANVCGKAPCAPEPLACGDTVVIAAGALTPGQLSAWPCSAQPWPGGERTFALSSASHQTAVVSVTGAAAATFRLFLVAPPIAGLCDSLTCLQSGSELKLGLPAGATQFVVLDTAAGLSGELKLVVHCSMAKKCGDGQCHSEETCAGCSLDCGPCPSCGDGKCTGMQENCGSCAKDCGACPETSAPECAAKRTPSKIGEFPCSECVCGKDPYCCETAWDGLCVGQCSNDCGGPACSKPGFCGDGQCTGEEKPKDCPMDCGDTTTCGDGSCAGSEACATCPSDCGVCAGGLGGPVCGDGTCAGPEHCAVCAVDCGVCNPGCAAMVASATPGCAGCACEAAVCAKDAYCCATAWDVPCATACAAWSGLACPKDACGDGICSGVETCLSCSKDCGGCTCGDGSCQFPEGPQTCPGDCSACGDGLCTGSESTASCKQDCGVGCEGKCGKISVSAQGKACWCDAKCLESGDCCGDKALFCGP